MEEKNDFRATKFGKGFVKEDVLNYINELNLNIMSLEQKIKAELEKRTNSQQDVSMIQHQMNDIQRRFDIANPPNAKPMKLRTDFIGGGFVKNDVFNYLEILNSKIGMLEEQLRIIDNA